jgi:hypothetical protein
MASRKYLATLLSVGFLVATLAFAADPLPPSPPPPPPPAPTSATVLWVYGSYYENLAPAWYFIGDFDTKEACTKAILALNVTPPQEDQGCFRLGLDPNHMHPEYVGDPTTPLPTPPPPAK